MFLSCKLFCMLWSGRVLCSCFQKKCFRSFYTAKETIDKIKRHLTEWEKIFAIDITDKGLMFKIQKQQLNIKKQTTWLKNGQKTWINIFPKRKETQMVNRHMKRCSISLVISEMQIKTALRYHLTLVRMTSKKNINNKCWWRCGEKGTLAYHWQECKSV